MWKVSAEESLFPGLACHFFIFLYLCHSPTTCYSWVLFLKLEVVHCVLSFWLLCVMLRSYMLILFQDQYLWISFQIEPDVTLCYHCMQPLELAQTKNGMSSHSLRFPSGLLKLSSKKYKANYFGAWKNTKKVLKLTKLMIQISKFRLIYEKSNKISIFHFQFIKGLSLYLLKAQRTKWSMQFFPLLSFHCCSTTTVVCKGQRKSSVQIISYQYDWHSITQLAS